MEEYQLSNAELHGLVFSYALDALDDGDKSAFEEHLREGCKVCEAELRSLREVTGELANSVAMAPPASLRQRLVAKMDRTRRAPGILLDQGGLLISSSREMAWESLAPGIAFKPLYTDTARRYNTLLVRMEAGARYPSHHHKDVEELFLLSGDLHVAGEVMRAGDYCRADNDSIHGETFSESGCLFLLLASQDNEVLA